MITNYQDFGYVEGEFINLYGKENPIMEAGQIGYFLINNNDDNHRPLLSTGIIIEDRFTDGLNKIYFVEIIEIIESPKTIDEFFTGQQFYVFTYENEVVKNNRKLKQINKKFNYKTNLFKIESFFMRDTVEKAVKLRLEYISIIRKDLVDKIKELDSI